MIIITNKIPKECGGGGRGYIWYDTEIPKTKSRFNWSLTYDRIPEPNYFSDEYLNMFPEDFEEPKFIEKMLIKLKVKINDPRRRFKNS